MAEFLEWLDSEAFATDCRRYRSMPRSHDHEAAEILTRLKHVILAKHEEAMVKAVATAAACCQSDYSEMLTDLKIALKAASVALGDIARRDREMQMTEMRCIARDTKSIVDYALLEKKP